MKLTEKQVEELQSLLCSWEDANISDYEYCNQVGKILKMGDWTFKGTEYNKDKRDKENINIRRILKEKMNDNKKEMGQ